MNKEQAQEEYLKLLAEKVKEEDRIMEEAKAQGKWKPGLDSNRGLFTELNQEFQKKIELLKSMVD